jgi:NAD(P)-dependent dehydrogenase (short-subunit alcohol dehydrogenase family)
MDASESIDRYAGTLAGRTALVTGAGTGIGRACAIAFGRSGADVALLGRREEPLRRTAEAIEGLGRKTSVLPCDVRDPGAVDAAVARATQELGPVTIAVANAGANAWADLEDLAAETLRALSTNVGGRERGSRRRAGACASEGRRFHRVASDNGRRPSGGGGTSHRSRAGAGALLCRAASAGVSVHVVEPDASTRWYPSDEDAPRTRCAEDVGQALFSPAPRARGFDEVLMLPGLSVDPW